MTTLNREAQERERFEAWNWNRLSGNEKFYAWEAWQARSSLPPSSQEAALQAEIDRLMLEYCPNEMTAEQMENWARHQKPSAPHPARQTWSTDGGWKCLNCGGVLTQHKGQIFCPSQPPAAPEQPTRCLECGAQLLGDGACPKHGWSPKSSQPSMGMVLAQVSERTVLSQLSQPAGGTVTEPQYVQQLRKEIEGWKEEAQLLRAHRDYFKQRVDMITQHQKNEVWYWQGDGEDHPESMGNSMVVVIRADQLRHLLQSGERGKDAKRLDWLEQQIVKVSAELRYGGPRHLFTSSPERDEGVSDPSGIRKQIDAAMSAMGGGE